MSNVKAFSSENFCPTNGGFGGSKGLKTELLVLRPPKNTSLRENASFDVFCVKIRAGVLAVDEMKNQKKRKNSRVNNLMREIAHAQKRNPLSDVNELLHDGRYPRRNHVGKFW